MSLVKGIAKFIDPNKYGYTPTLSVNGAKYGGDTKLDKARNFPDIQKGDTVEFESFDSDYNGKNYPKYKAQTLKIVPKDASAAASGARNFGNGVASKEVDWDAKDARISYQGALERAILFADLAFRTNALPLPNANNKKLEVLQAFVDEQALKYHTDSYASTTPAKKAAKVSAPAQGAAEEREPGSDDAEGDENWS